MKKPISIDKAKQRLPSFITLDESTYVNTHKKAKFIDNEYGEFWAVPKDVWKGHGHRKRGIKKQAESATTTVAELASRLPLYLKIKEETYTSLQNEATFIDADYGEFIAKPRDVLKFKKHRKRQLTEKRGGSLLTLEEIKTRLPPELTIVEDSFVDTQIKCKFIDRDYGEFETTPNSIFVGYGCYERAKEKRKQTCLERYGVEHVMLKREFLVKSKQSARKTCKFTHWKTGDQLFCCGGYEKQVVEYLNANKIDFDWQVAFNLSCGTYYCDLYLKDKDLYVEIKGWWRQQISKDKWDEFHLLYPNSELWDRNRMRELGFKVK